MEKLFKAKTAKQDLGTECEGIIEVIIDKNRKNNSKKKDINTIIDNDSVLQEIHKKIGKLNDIAFDRLKEDKDAMRILR